MTGDSFPPAAAARDRPVFDLQPAGARRMSSRGKISRAPLDWDSRGRLDDVQGGATRTVETPVPFDDAPRGVDPVDDDRNVGPARNDQHRQMITMRRNGSGDSDRAKRQRKQAHPGIPPRATRAFARNFT